jgi:MoaA/NifB/PqqE/SkfB family radical SAM enzyme
MTSLNYKKKKDILKFRTVPPFYKMFFNFIKHNCFQTFSKPFLPKSLCLYVTYRCNMRCRMCGIWKENIKEQASRELSLKELDHILSDPLFSKLEFININGGEPNLRLDLPQIVTLLHENFQNLKTVSLNSNGLPSNRAITNVKKIGQICRQNSTLFSVSISLHEVGKAFDKISGIEGAYLKVKETLDALKEIQNEYRFYLGINCVITKMNLSSLSKMLDWSEREKIPVNFTLGEIRERFNNLILAPDIEIENGSKQLLISFFETLAKNKSLFNHHAFRYKLLADMIKLDKKRNIACQYAMGGAILGSNGTLYYCKDSRGIGNCRDRSAYSLYYDKKNLLYREKKLLGEKCMRCPPNTFNRIELEKDILKYLAFLIKG